MRTKIILTAVFITLLAALSYTFRRYVEMKNDRDRLRQNQSILLHNGRVEITRTSDGRSHASAPAINLRADEFRQSADPLVKVARQAGIKPSRISTAATAATATSVYIETQLTTVPSDTSTVAPTYSQTPRHLSYTDPWTSLTGTIADSSFRGSISTTDTLDIIIHRIPRRFLFFRFGCREVRIDISSRNPHTRLTYAKFYQLVR
ncbi:DUF6549 family protein [Hoylesella marshii]|uniref:Uncharacterized protein n=1 Tax=Hoylesella marshii DSM 16973 = JCM 13450 TaxID=862515 RepID=E0NST6_9BACT|nr:DUF6549 family protein [Hoylesella marshii]EFM01800.1 hypothetical protein HMPREF0658_1288 [Hoylesella marshii DSM 16973 = JCM 13450]